MKAKIGIYLAFILLTYFLISCAWSIRDIQAFHIENGIGFADYSPKMWPYLLIHAVLFIATLIIGIYFFCLEIIIPLILALGAALVFYKLHYDPFYRDWPEDCWFARIKYITIGVVILGLKDIAIKFLPKGKAA